MGKLHEPIMIPKNILDFYQALSSLHQTYSKELSPIHLTRSDKDSYLNQKAPLLNFVEFKLEQQEVTEAYEEVKRVLLKHQPDLKTKITRISNAIAKDEQGLVALLEKFVWQDREYVSGLAKKSRLNEDLLAIILFNTVKPFMISYAQGLKGQYNDELWRESYCPVCGWKPVMAISTKEDNQRLLHCSLCDNEWSFKSMECPHCLNEDHETLKYLTVEKDEVFRINVCEKCKGYIKTIKEGNTLSKETYFITDVKTLHLDILAEREGYSKEIKISPQQTLN